jgi:hypothetical protein
MTMISPNSRDSTQQIMSLELCDHLF